MVKDVRKLQRYLYGDLIALSYRNTLQARCNGCAHPSQSQHSCFETFDIVDGTPGATELYIEAESKVSKFYLGETFIKMGKSLDPTCFYVRCLYLDSR